MLQPASKANHMCLNGRLGDEFCLHMYPNRMNVTLVGMRKVKTKCMKHSVLRAEKTARRNEANVT